MSNATEDSTDETPLTDEELAELEALSEKDEDELSDAEVTSKIRLSVKRRFDFPTWIVAFEFENREGRRADCLAFNCKAGRNFKLVGFEFKASRSDWLAEKRDPDKSDLFVQLCDEWYVIAGRRGIVNEDELPDGWGLFELKPSGQLWKLVESDLNDMQNTELDRRFYTRFMRKAVGEESNFTHEDIKEAEKRGFERAQEKMVEDHLDLETERMKEKAEAFEQLKENGLHIYRSVSEERIERLKKADSLIQQIDADSYTALEGKIQSISDTAERRLEELQDVSEELQGELDDLREELPEEDVTMPGNDTEDSGDDGTATGEGD